MLLKTVAFMGDEKTQSRVYGNIKEYSVETIIGVYFQAEVKELNTNHILSYRDGGNIKAEAACAPLTVQVPGEFISPDDDKDWDSLKEFQEIIHKVHIICNDDSTIFLHGRSNSFYFMNDEGKTIDKY